MADDGEQTLPRDDVSVIRSEERLRSQIRTIPVERVRMRKVIVTEEKTITVSVRREELQLIREPLEDGITTAGTEVSGGGTNDYERTPDVAHSMVLSEERIVVTKITVPVQRVTLLKHRVTEQQAVTDTVRKERVEVEHRDTSGLPA